jgi:hypothetical protein
VSLRILEVLKFSWLLILLAAPLLAQERPLVIGEGDFTIQMDKGANIERIALGGNVVDLPVPYTYFELDGEDAQAAQVQGGKTPEFRLTSAKSAGILNVAFDKDVRFRFQPAQKGAVEKVGVVLRFPADTVFHLAEYQNVGRMLDKDMPIGQRYRTTLRYNFFVAEYKGMFVRLRADDRQWLSRADVEIARHPQMFTVTFSWNADTELRVGAFHSLDEVVADHEAWMQREVGMKTWADKPHTPAWLHDIKLIITLDMLRPNWEITNDFEDLLNLAKELRKIRNPREVLFYIPGWQGAYDSSHPTYRPNPLLGGDAKFREALDYLHQNGFRVMIHSTGWGIDPYHPEIDQLEKLALRDEKGEAYGWQMNERGNPPKTSLHFTTPEVPLHAPARARIFSFTTDAVPAECEANFTIGGIKAAKARVRMALGRRTVSTPPNWFKSHREYPFPYPLALHPGKNEIQVSVSGADDIDWSGAWYKIRYTFVPRSPYTSWTWPILMADMNNPEYIRIFTQNLKSVVEQFHIDAVHVDATSFFQRITGDVAPRRGRALCLALREALPPYVALASEWFQTYEEMNFWHITQNARESLKDYEGISQCPCEQSGLIPTKGVAKSQAWLDKVSPVCNFSRKYILVYPHLCAANAFVPVGKVCNIFPPRQMPPDKEEEWDVLRRAKELNFTPGLRVNYHRFGLDEDSRKAIMELP